MKLASVPFGTIVRAPKAGRGAGAALTPLVESESAARRINFRGIQVSRRETDPGTACVCCLLLPRTNPVVMAASVESWCFMSSFAISLEDDAFVWATAEVEIADDDMASACVVQFASVLFARMQDEAPDWSNCRIRLASRNGDEVLVSSAAEAALLERDRIRCEAFFRTDH